jgi:Zn-dependent protease
MAPHALACPACHTLVHSEELAVLSARATQLENEGATEQALEGWRKALPLLPSEARQTAWVRDHIEKLELARVAPPRPPSAWARRLGPLAPIALFLAKAKWLLAVFKLNFLFSLGAFLGVYWALWGWKFGVGFGVLVLIHELGHYLEIRRRGLPADMPVFLPGLGAYVRWGAMGVSLETRAAVSLAGPFAGFLASVGCLLVWWKTGDPLWAALTRAGAWINVANLVPVWILDGGQAANALDRNGRWAVLVASVAFAALFSEGAFLIVAAGALWRLFGKDLPALPSVRATAYFVGVLGLLGMVLRLAPGRGFGQP